MNPQFFLLLCRQLIFEVGEIANVMLDLKMETIEESEVDVPSEHQIAKVNFLADQGICYFQK